MLAPISMEVRHDLPDFCRRMLAAERRSGNQIFAHRQSADDNGVETTLSDEAEVVHIALALTLLARLYLAGSGFLSSSSNLLRRSRKACWLCRKSPNELPCVAADAPDPR